MSVQQSFQYQLSKRTPLEDRRLTHFLKRESVKNQVISTLGMVVFDRLSFNFTVLGMFFLFFLGGGLFGLQKACDCAAERVYHRGTGRIDSLPETAMRPMLSKSVSSSRAIFWSETHPFDSLGGTRFGLRALNFDGFWGLKMGWF